MSLFNDASAIVVCSSYEMVEMKMQVHAYYYRIFILYMSVPNMFNNSPNPSSKKVDIVADNECGICLGEYENGDQICKSAHKPFRPGYSLQTLGENNNDPLDEDTCPHVFHLDCIMEWLMKKRAKGLCPLCRRTFLSMEGLENQYHGSSRSARARWLNRGSSSMRGSNRMDETEGNNRTRWMSRATSSDLMSGSEGGNRGRQSSRLSSSDRMDSSDGSHRGRWTLRNVTNDVSNARMDDIEEQESTVEANDDDNQS